MRDDHTVTVRPGTAADVEAAGTIVRTAEARRSDRSLRELENRGRMGRRLALPDAFFFVAQSAEDDLIGLAVGMSARQDGGSGPIIPGLCHVGTVAVRPEHWGKGVGKQLLQALLAHACDLGYGRFQLFTHADNARAQRLYEGMGFTLTDQTAVSSTGENIVHYLWAPRRLSRRTGRESVPYEGR